MLLEDGILLMYVEKQSWTNTETETAEIQTTLIAEIPASDADNWTLTPRQDDEISEYRKNHELMISLLHHQQANTWSRVMKSQWKKHLKNILRE